MVSTPGETVADNNAPVTGTVAAGSGVAAVRFPEMSHRSQYIVRRTCELLPAIIAGVPFTCAFSTSLPARHPDTFATQRDPFRHPIEPRTSSGPALAGWPRLPPISLRDFFRGLRPGHAHVRPRMEDGVCFACGPESVWHGSGCRVHHQSAVLAGVGQACPAGVGIE